MSLYSQIQEKILPFVEKPARYVGGEINSVSKPAQGRTTVALIYPDAYEVGISNLGLKILYHLLNQEEDFVCERSYSPWIDMEKELRAHNLPLYSLESKTPLGEFDILGFSFQYELLYTNFLNVLDLSGIPFRSIDRQDSHPFILGGGPAAMNLEPIAHFLDAVCLGDGESRIVEMSRMIRAGRLAGKARSAILADLAGVEGVYVPSLYQEKTLGKTIHAAGRPVRRFVEPDLESIDFCTNQILPNIRAVQDRAVIEVARGCTRGCRFCQAGMTYRPLRERSVPKLLELTREAIRQTGYREFSLISLSISDYSRLFPLVDALDRQFSEHGVSFSLPSLRLDTFSLELAQKVQEIRKSGLTFAVEGGTQRIRDIINKGVTEEELIAVLDIAGQLGWKSVKLYFMIGLPQGPGEEPEDEIQGIQDLVGRLSKRYPRLTITVSAAIFVPKPHTPFQWDRQLSLEEGREAFTRLLNPYRKNPKINIRFNSPKVSFLEGVFSRGDRSLSRVVELAWQKGARFDGWHEHFNLDLWMECFQELGIDPEVYLQARPLDAPLPWDVTDNGAAREFLVLEREKAWTAGLTPDCRDGCVACEVCDFDTVQNREAPDTPAEIKPEWMAPIQVRDHEAVSSMRFVFTKEGEQRYLTQVDIEEMFSRAMIRAEIPVKFSIGFNPHISIEMGWAIPTGFESEYEVSQVDLWDEISPDTFVTRLNATLPPGIQILQARPLPLGNKLNKKTKQQMVEFEIDCPFSDAEIAANIEKNHKFEKITPKSTKEIDIAEFVKQYKIIDQKMTVAYFQTDGGARIQDVITALCGWDTAHALAWHPRVLKRLSENKPIMEV